MTEKIGSEKYQTIEIVVSVCLSVGERESANSRIVCLFSKKCLRKKVYDGNISFYVFSDIL